MPALAQTSDELRLIAWLKAEGEKVTEGEPLFEAESDKATHEVEATVSGTLLRVLCEPNQRIEVGTVLAWMGEPGEQIPELEASAARSDTTGSPRTAPDAKTETAMIFIAMIDSHYTTRSCQHEQDEWRSKASCIHMVTSAMQVRLWRATAMFLILGGIAMAQTASQPQFEVASVKPAAPDQRENLVREVQHTIHVRQPVHRAHEDQAPVAPLAHGRG